MAKKALSKMNKEELINEAKQRGIYTVEMDSMTKADILALLKGDDEKPTEEEANQAKGLDGSKVTGSFFNMRTAIAGAFKAGNRHAITKDEAYIGSATEESWKAWKIWCEQLFYDAVRAYYVAKVNRDDDKGEKLNKAYSVWRSLLAVGNEDQFHKNMFIEDGDIEYFFAFIQSRGSIEGVGGYWATVGRQNFRKEVEFLVGARMAQAVVAGDEEHELVVTYKSKLKTVDTMTERLEGRTNDEGHHEPGITESIASMEKSIELFSQNLKDELNASEEQVRKFTAKMRAELEELKKQEKSCKGSIEDAKKYLNEHKSEYEKVVDKIGKVIEDIDD